MAEERVYKTIDGDMIDLIAHREYGISSKVTEVLLDHNYRIADYPMEMPAGVDVELPPQNPVKLRDLIKMWD
jgi:phage tail protein X